MATLCPLPGREGSSVAGRKQIIDNEALKSRTGLGNLTWGAEEEGTEEPCDGLGKLRHIDRGDFRQLALNPLVAQAAGAGSGDAANVEVEARSLNSFLNGAPEARAGGSSALNHTWQGPQVTPTLGPGHLGRPVLQQ